jgi:hypothetical protein
LLNFGGSCFVCCCVYFNRYARSVKVTVRVLPGELPVSPENAGVATSSKLLYLWLRTTETTIGCGIYNYGSEASGKPHYRGDGPSVCPEYDAQRCQSTTFVPSVAQRCRRASVPPRPCRLAGSWQPAPDLSRLAMALAGSSRLAGRQPQAGAALGANRFARGLTSRATATGSRRAARLTGQRWSRG